MKMIRRQAITKIYRPLMKYAPGILKEITVMFVGYKEFLATISLVINMEMQSGISIAAVTFSGELWV